MAAVSRPVCNLGCDQCPANDQLGEGIRDLPVGFQVGLDVLPHGEGDVGVADALAEGFPVDLGVPACGGVTVADIVQVDFW